jgi:hypothetical protein
MFPQVRIKLVTSAADKIIPLYISILLMLLSVFILFSSPFCASASATDILILTDDKELYSVGLYMDILEDFDRKLAIDDIVSGRHDHKFVPSDRSAPGFGFTSSAYWFRFIIKNETSASKKYFLDIEYPLLDHVEFYAPDRSGSWVVTAAGDRLPFDTRVIKYRNFLFPVNLHQGEQATFYIRCETSSSLNMPVSLLSTGALVNRTEN